MRIRRVGATSHRRFDDRRLYRPFNRGYASGTEQGDSYGNTLPESGCAKAQNRNPGVGPTVVVVDDGMAKSLTTTMKDDIYAFIFAEVVSDSVTELRG